MNPKFDDWKSVKRIFRYLRGTSKQGLAYKVNSDTTLEAKTDSSFRYWNDSAFTSGYIITLFGNAIAWRSHKQNQITTSTCQAEYLAMSQVS